MTVSITVTLSFEKYWPGPWISDGCVWGQDGRGSLGGSEACGDKKGDGDPIRKDRGQVTKSQNGLLPALKTDMDIYWPNHIPGENVLIRNPGAPFSFHCSLGPSLTFL